MAVKRSKGYGSDGDGVDGEGIAVRCQFDEGLAPPSRLGGEAHGMKWKVKGEETVRWRSISEIQILIDGELVVDSNSDGIENDNGNGDGDGDDRGKIIEPWYLPGNLPGI